MANLTRTGRATALIMRNDECLIQRFTLHEPPLRYLAIETDDGGTLVEAQQAETLFEMARLLESSTVESIDTEIHDLDSGEVLRPDFERIYRIPRIYEGDTIVYQSAAEVTRLAGLPYTDPSS